MHTRARRASLIVLAGLTLFATLSLAARDASGRAPTAPGSIPDSAFRPVVLPMTGPDAEPTRDATPDLRPFAVALRSSAPAERPQPSIPLASPIVVARPTPASGGTLSGHSISGYASWYCRAGWSICTVGHPDGPGFDAYAAAGPKLRAALGSTWRGRVVTVDGIRVKLIDWCQCYKGEPNEKLIDLYYDVFARTGSRVTIRW